MTLLTNEQVFFLTPTLKLKTPSAEQGYRPGQVLRLGGELWRVERVSHTGKRLGVVNSKFRREILEVES